MNVKIPKWVGPYSSSMIQPLSENAALVSVSTYKFGQAGIETYLVTDNDCVLITTTYCDMKTGLITGSVYDDASDDPLTEALYSKEPVLSVLDRVC